MIGFNYKYTSSSDIIKNIPLLSEYTNIQFVILVVSIILLISAIFYFVPYVNIYYTFIKKQREKEKRKEMIKQIAMQKDINDEIEKELNI